MLHELLINTVKDNAAFKPKFIDPYLPSLSLDMKGVVQGRYYVIGANSGGM